jgi:hypothetical protein
VKEAKMSEGITRPNGPKRVDGSEVGSSGAETENAPYSTRALWAGRILSGLAVVFLIFDVAMKLLMPPVAVEGTRQLGWPESAMSTLGVIQLICLVVYLIPRTAVIGAVLWTGYLGGAIATHVRVADLCVVTLPRPCTPAVTLDAFASGDLEVEATWLAGRRSQTGP